MCAFIAPKDFIVRANAHKVFIIVMQTLQVTQATSFCKVKPKIVFNIGCDNLTPNMAIIFSIHALHLQRLVCSWKHEWQFKKNLHQKQSTRIEFFEEVYVII
jgi:hypothetical protein